VAVTSLDPFKPRIAGRRLEREHREGTAEDIGQPIPVVGSPVIEQLRKFFAQYIHQCLEGDFLLYFLKVAR
jgi:hypothetical protein